MGAGAQVGAMRRVGEGVAVGLGGETGLCGGHGVLPFGEELLHDLARLPDRGAPACQPQGQDHHQRYYAAQDRLRGLLPLRDGWAASASGSVGAWGAIRRRRGLQALRFPFGAVPSGVSPAPREGVRVTAVVEVTSAAGGVSQPITSRSATATFARTQKALLRLLHGILRMMASRPAGRSG